MTEKSDAKHLAAPSPFNLAQIDRGGLLKVIDRYRVLRDSDESDPVDGLTTLEWFQQLTVYRTMLAGALAIAIPSLEHYPGLSERKLLMILAANAEIPDEVLDGMRTYFSSVLGVHPQNGHLPQVRQVTTGSEAPTKDDKTR